MTFSHDTLNKALKALAAGKTIDDYDLPQSVKDSIRNRRYSDADIARAMAQVSKREPVFPADSASSLQDPA